MAKILLVEDDNNLREIYEARLQAEGYTIVSAHDGEEALVVAKNEKPDLIISDVMMPKISGFEMLDILRNTEGLKDVKVVMLTALGQSDDQQRANKLGANRYLVKSQVTLEDIVKVAQELLNEGDAAADSVVEAISTPPATDSSTESTATPVEEMAVAEPSAPIEETPVVEPVQEPVASEPVAEATPVEPVITASEPPVATEPATDVSPVDSTMPTDDSTTSTITDPAQEPVAEPPTDVTPEPEVNSETVSEPSIVAQASDSQPTEQPNDSAAQNLVADDKLMDDAVNNLVSTPPVPDSPVAEPTEAAKEEPVTSDISLPSLSVPEADQESVKQESTEVESQIEDFANSDTDEPTPVPAEASETEATTDSTSEPTNDGASSEDDSTSPQIKVNPSTELVGEQDAPSGAEDDAADAALAEMNSMPGKKVIAPISAPEDRPDINTLLAQEEAKQASEAAGITTAAQPEPVVMSTLPTAPASTNITVTSPPADAAASTTTVDPNSIAL
ncbi:MAG TPA: response regulator [Candidatus Saccharimonadales bacterium]